MNSEDSVFDDVISGVVLIVASWAFDEISEQVRATYVKGKMPKGTTDAKPSALPIGVSLY